MTSQVKQMKQVFREAGVTQSGDAPSVQVEREASGCYKPLEVFVDPLTDAQKERMTEECYGYRDVKVDGKVEFTVIHEVPQDRDDNSEDIDWGW